MDVRKRRDGEEDVLSRLPAIFAARGEAEEAPIPRLCGKWPLSCEQDCLIVFEYVERRRHVLWL